jgi:phosphoglycerol transferase MdoB-like AlkP superfamily enzyme
VISSGAGFDNYISLDEENPQAKEQKAAWGIHDELFYSKSIDYISGLSDENFLGVLFTVSSHFPFKGTPNNVDGTGDSSKDYELSIQYSGNAAVDFLNKAKTQPWFSETLFVILGDHTPPLTAEWIKKVEYTSKVPLILYKPGASLSACNFNSIGSQVDLPNTVFDLMNLKVNNWAPFGTSLLNHGKNYSFVTKGQDVYVLTENKISKKSIHSISRSKETLDRMIYKNLLDYVYRLENNHIYK